MTYARGLLSIFFTFVFFLFYISLFCQSTIKGSAPSFAGDEIQLFTYKDYITKAKGLIDTKVIAQDGTFQFNIKDDSKTFYGIFKTGNFAATLFIEPGVDYEISILKPDTVSLHSDRINYLEINIIKPEKEDLNRILGEFDEKYHSFVKRNYALFLQKSAKNEVDSFKIKISKEYLKKANAYLQTYVQYTFASLDLIATANRPKVYSMYLEKEPVHYMNDSYMAFFNEFYYKELESFQEKNLKDKFLEAVNVKKSYEEVINILAKDKLLGNEKIRELALLKVIYENFNNKDFDKNGIRMVLKELVKKSSIPEHVEIGMNILQETGKLGAGTKAPDFSLYDQDKKLVSLSQFKGKYVYLDFWATWCAPCLKEMPSMEALKNKFGKEIVFISISIDQDFEAMEKFLRKKKNYDWIFLHLGNQPEIKELFNVLAIPSYFLIDPDGLISQSPASKPGKEMEETLFRITSGKGIRKKADWDW